MKTSILAVCLIMITTLQAHADIIKCHFFEPSMITTYSMAQQTLTVLDEATEKTTVKENVSFQIKASGEFELRDKDNNLIQKLKLNNRGDDGASGLAYPYEVQYMIRVGGASSIHGGCTSNSLPSREQ